MKPESRRVVRHIQQNFDHSTWTINDRKCLLEALKSLSIDEIKENAQQIFENKSVLEIDCFIKRLHHSRESDTKIKNCNPEFKYIECINLWSQLMYDIIGDKVHDSSSLMIGKLMSLIGKNEVPKNPEKTNGVNYRLIYNFLSNVLMGLPAPTLEPLESAVILELLETMFFKLSVSDFEAHKHMLQWKYDALTAKDGKSNKQQIQRALENDFQHFATSDLSDSDRKKLLEPEQKRGKQQEILHQLLKKPKTVKKPRPKPIPKEETDKKSTVIYEIQHVDELLPDGTKATVVKLNPIVVSLADPSMKPLWENNEQPVSPATDSKENPKETTSTKLVEDNNVMDREDYKSEQKKNTTAFKYPVQKEKANSEYPVDAVASSNRPQEKPKRPSEDDIVARKFQKMEDCSREHCKDRSICEPSKSFMLMPDTLWINPLCIPPHLTNIELFETNQ